MSDKIHVGVFTTTGYLKAVYVKFLPRVGDYLQLGYGYEYVAWRVEAVVIQDDNYREWDIVVVVDKTPLKEPSKEAYNLAEQTLKIERRERFVMVRRDRERFFTPNDAWVRRKAFFGRVEAGESIEAIAQAEQTTLQRVKILSGDWRRLRNSLRNYSNLEVDGKTFDVSLLDGRDA